MRIYSLNQLNFREAHIPSEKAVARFTTACLPLGLVAFGFVAVLNYGIFKPYFYGGYGFAASCLTIAFVFLLQMKFGIMSVKLPCNYWGNVLFMILTAAYCVLSALCAKGGYRYMGAILNTMGVVTVISHSRVGNNHLRSLLLLLLLTGSYCAIHIRGYFDATMTTLQDMESSVNSNYLAFFGNVLMIYGNYFLTKLRKRERLFTQMIRLLLCAGAFYIIWECKSRGCLMCWLFYVVCVYLVPVRFFQSRKTAWIACLLVIGGVAITWLYVTRLHSISATFMGKSTLTRYRLWGYFWNSVFRNPFHTLFGYGTHSEQKALFGYGFHNIYIGIWYEVGLVGLFIFMSFVIWNIRKAYRQFRHMDCARIYALVGFLSFMVSDYFAVTFTGPLVVWNYALLGLVFC